MRSYFRLLLMTTSLLSLTSVAYAATDITTQFTTYLNSPDVVYFLLIFAIYCIFFEAANPGLLLPGIIGVTTITIAFYAMHSLPVNYAGLSLIFIGLAFIILEFVIFSYGLLGIAGLCAFILGSFMLFDTADPRYQLSLHIIVAMTVLSVAFFAVVVTMAVRSQKRVVITGKEGLIGATGHVISVINQQIIVRVMGELWEAQSDDILQAGDKVQVTQIKDLVLTVNKQNSFIRKGIS